MILLYQLPATDKGTLVKEFLGRIKKSYLTFGASEASLSPQALLDGNKEIRTEVETPSESGIFFTADETEEEIRHLLELLAQAGIEFRYVVLLNDELMQRPINDILMEQKAHQDFLKELRYVKGLIDGCDKLKAEDYDPDRWSELKFAVADVNDAMSLIFEEDEETQATGRHMLKERTDKLKATMERLLTYRRPD